MNTHDIVVIGGSKGAIPPLRRILGNLPPNLAASVFVVLHIPSRSKGIVTAISGDSALPVMIAEDGMTIERGSVYMAAPDRHLIINDGHLRLGWGPRENLVRPAIDPLFRSAAVNFGSRVIGIILSGTMNDGAAGLRAVVRCGGLALVQDPASADADEMPLSALAAVTVNYRLPVKEMSDLLPQLVGIEAGAPVPPPTDLRLEVEIAAGGPPPYTKETAALPVPLTCPSCGGVLSEVINEEPLRFRCQVGHAFTADVLATQYKTNVEEALRMAMRTMEERVDLTSRMARDAEDNGRHMVAELYRDRSHEFKIHAETLREAVLEAMLERETKERRAGREGKVTEPFPS
jgi:two-component system chemotaxis response regulator CheB